MATISTATTSAISSSVRSEKGKIRAPMRMCCVLYKHARISNRMRRFTDFRKPIAVFTTKYFYFLISDEYFFLLSPSAPSPSFPLAPIHSVRRFACFFLPHIFYSFVHFVHFYASDVFCFHCVCMCVESVVCAHTTRCSSRTSSIFFFTFSMHTIGAVYERCFRYGVQLRLLWQCSKGKRATNIFVGRNGNTKKENSKKWKRRHVRVLSNSMLEHRV